MRRWLVAALLLFAACGEVKQKQDVWYTVTDPATGVSMRCTGSGEYPICYRP